MSSRYGEDKAALLVQQAEKADIQKELLIFIQKLRFMSMLEVKEVILRMAKVQKDVTEAVTPLTEVEEVAAAQLIFDLMKTTFTPESSLQEEVVDLLVLLVNMVALAVV